MLQNSIECIVILLAIIIIIYTNYFIGSFNLRGSFSP